MDSRPTDGDDFVAADDHPTDGIVPGESTPLSVLFDALSNARSRYVLYHLLDQPENTVSLDELVSAVRTRTIDQEDESADERGLRGAFHHHHLPKLGDAGLVEYDPEAETVTFVGEVDRIEPYVSLSRRADE